MKRILLLTILVIAQAVLVTACAFDSANNLVPSNALEHESEFPDMGENVTVSLSDSGEPRELADNVYATYNYPEYGNVKSYQAVKKILEEKTYFSFFPRRPSITRIIPVQAVFVFRKQEKLDILGPRNQLPHIILKMAQKRTR